jgi:type VI secretion system secreted protein VgrG
MARVKVAFHLKTGNIETDWIRLSGNAAGPGYGLYFVPEITNEVTIIFEGNNAEKPLVHCVNYNGNAKSGYGTPDNSFKVIKTTSGHYLEFEELKNIKLGDKKGNIFHIDSTGNTLNITALETINLNAKNININASENIISSAGKDIDATAGGNISQIASGNIFESADSKQEIVEGKITVTSAEYTEVSEKITLNTTKENMTLKASKTIVANSGEKSNFY